jgi:aminoglycoside 3-N-acetyltransferase
MIRTSVKKVLKFKKKVQKSIQKPISKEEIVNGLIELGIQKGDVVFVHSSLSKFGNVINGPKTIIDALLEVIGEQGTLAMPGFNIQVSMKNTLEMMEKGDVIYNYKTSAPTTGIICKIFKTDYNPEISIHPTHSVLALGKQAGFVVNSHEKSEKTFGEGSPLFNIKKLNGKILGLGSDLGHVTFYHVLEDIEEDFPIKVYDEKYYNIRYYDKDGQIQIKKLQSHNYQKVRIEKINGSFIRGTFLRNLKKKRIIKFKKIGGANTWAMLSTDLFNYLKEEMHNNRTIYTKAPNIFYSIYYTLSGTFHQLNR